MQVRVLLVKLNTFLTKFKNGPESGPYVKAQNLAFNCQRLALKRSSLKSKDSTRQRSLNPGI